MKFEAQPVAWVESSRKEAIDDDWSSVESSIVLDESFDEAALQGIEDFSHVEITFCFHQVDPAKIERGARHPRGNTEWPKTGIFAQRAKNRPNRIGQTTCRLVKREGRRLHVADLDCIDGTPVLDIKPFVREFMPRHAVHQPGWIGEVLKDYWVTGRRSTQAAVRRVALRAHHMAPMVEFYSRVFGAEFAEERTGSLCCFVADVGGLTLKLVPLRDETDFEGYPLHQLGLEVPDVDECVRLALECGGRLEGEVIREGCRAHACVRDPDGNTIELFRVSRT